MTNSNSTSQSMSLLISSTAAAAIGAFAALYISKYTPGKNEKAVTCTKNEDLEKEQVPKSLQKSTSFLTDVMVSLPDWANDSFATYAEKEYKTDEEKMNLAIELSRRNSIVENTGGPFGSAIFYKSKLIAIGMNRVVPLNNSTLHGETVAIQMAQMKCRTYSLHQLCSQGSNHTDEKKESCDVYELFTSCEPCAMCIGATLWSGVGRMVCGASKADAMAIGFDEGPVFPASYQYLMDRGIEVVKGVCKEEAAKVLREYGQIGVIYNR